MTQTLQKLYNQVEYFSVIKQRIELLSMVSQHLKYLYISFMKNIARIKDFT